MSHPHADLMRACLKAAETFVAARRAQAPPGFEPRNGAGANTPAESNFDYGDAINQMMSALETSAPSNIGASQAVDPSLTALSLGNVGNMLMGTPKGTNTMATGSSTMYINPATGALSASDGGNSWNGQGDWATVQVPQVTTLANPAKPGLASLQAQAAQTANLADPMGGALTNQLGMSALSNLQAGTNLPAGLARNAEQGVLASNIGALGGTGNVGAYQQALGMSQFANNWYNQNFANASSALGSSANFYLPYGQQLTQLAAGYAQPISSYFNPNMQLASNQADTYYNATAASGIDKANNTNALYAAGISSVGGIAGAAMGGA